MSEPYTHLRWLCLLAAIVIYGFWGTPTPDSPGLAEALVAVFLILAAGLWRMAYCLWRPLPAGWERTAQILLLYGLSFPVVAGVLSGHDVTAIIRDIAPFLFFLLPLFLNPLLQSLSPWRKRGLTVVIALAGWLFAARILIPLWTDRGGVWHLATPADPFYLANAPTVLFSALLLIGGAGFFLYRNYRPSSMAASGFLILLALVPVMAMVLITQRASIGVMAAAVSFLLLIAFIRNPLRALLPALVLAVVLWAGWGVVGAVGDQVLIKTAQVGLNMRLHEMRAVFDAAGQSVPATLFGKGWGALFESPAVGGQRVNFTHNLLTTYFLKTGFAGVILAVAYIYGLGVRLLHMAFANPLMAVAIAGPFLIDVFFYASFKSLDFGLLLLLIPLWQAAVPQLHIARRYSIQ